MERIKQGRQIHSVNEKGRVTTLNRIISQGFATKMDSGQISERSEGTVKGIHREECFRQKEQQV